MLLKPISPSNFPQHQEIIMLIVTVFKESIWPFPPPFTDLNVMVTGGLSGLSHLATTLGLVWLILQVSYSSLETLYTMYFSSSSVPRTPRARPPLPPPLGQIMLSWSNSNGEFPEGQSWNWILYNGHYASKEISRIIWSRSSGIEIKRWSI